METIKLERIAKQPKAYNNQQKLEAIREAARPGQELTLSQAIDLLCDIYLASRIK